LEDAAHQHPNVAPGVEAMEQGYTTQMDIQAKFCVKPSCGLHHVKWIAHTVWTNFLITQNNKQLFIFPKLYIKNLVCGKKNAALDTFSLDQSWKNLPSWWNSNMHYCI